MFGNEWFSVVPIWIFFICGQLVVLNYENTVLYLKLLKQKDDHIYRYISGKRGSVAQEMLETLFSMKQLNVASHFLQWRFRIMLTAISFLSAVTLLTASYYIIDNSIHRKIKVVALWDAADIIDSILRLWLVCHTSDSMRKAVKKFWNTINGAFYSIKTGSKIILDFYVY